MTSLLHEYCVNVAQFSTAEPGQVATCLKQSLPYCGHFLWSQIKYINGYVIISFANWVTVNW